MIKIFLLAVTLFNGCTTRQGYKIKENPEKLRNIFYEGENGESIESAVIIRGAKNQKKGVEAEYSFIAAKHGRQDKDWRVVSQSQSKEQKKVFDIIEIEIKKTKTREYFYFDITKCSWTP